MEEKKKAKGRTAIQKMKPREEIVVYNENK